MGGSPGLTVAAVVVAAAAAVALVVGIDAVIIALGHSVATTR